MTDLHALSATEAAQRIAAGSLSAEKLTRALLDRIELREGTVGAFEHLDPEQALATARAVDRGDARGPLRGVPIAVKDLMDTADMPTTYGSPIYRGWRPRADAAAVALARAAGAVVLGKTVTTEFAMFHPGKTTNPHDARHTPGGSSSGSAAAVADAMVPLALGTQTAGSVIRPAAFCGVVGYKPSFGMIPRAGTKPLAESLDTIGVIARSVADAALFAGVLTGRRELLDAAAPVRLGHARVELGLCLTHQWPMAAPETRALFERLPDILARGGVTPRPGEAPAEHRPLFEAQGTIMGLEAARALAWERMAHAAQLSRELRDLLAAGAAVTPADYDRARCQAQEARQALPAFFGAHDAVLVPAAPGEAPEGLAQTGDPAFNRIWTLLGVPCVTLPAGTGPRGLPLGVQLVGRIGDDARLLVVAALVERALAMVAAPVAS
jgi:amidase